MAGQGITLLLYLPTKQGSIERVLADKDIDGKDGVLITRTEEKQRQNIKTRMSPKDYYEFTEMTNTSAALLCVLFGEQCGLYVDVLTLSNIMTGEMIKNKKGLFHENRRASRGCS